MFALRGVLHFTLWMGQRALWGSPPLPIAGCPVGSGPKPGAAEVPPSRRFLKTTWFTLRLCLCHSVDGWLLSAANLGPFIIRFHTAVMVLGEGLPPPS